MKLFKPATKQQSKLRMALVGPSGSGKTFTALNIAQHLGSRVAVIDTERGSASKYSDLFQFDVLELTSFSPAKYLEGIHGAAAAGYDVLVIDSLSHAWSGRDGILEFVDKAAARSKSNNSFGAWRDATPLHNSLVDGILESDVHVIVTMRAKTEYVQERNERTGRTEIRKVGMQPVQRDGLEYEFDVVADLDMDNNLIIDKTRCIPLAGMVQHQAGAETAAVLKAWLTDGAPAPERPVSDSQLRSLGAAVTAAQLSSKDAGRQFLAFMAGNPEMSDPRTELTWRAAEEILQHLGDGTNGNWTVDPAKIMACVETWQLAVDLERSEATPEGGTPLPAAATDLPEFDPHAKAQTARAGKTRSKALAGMAPLDPEDDRPVEWDEPTQEGLNL